MGREGIEALLHGPRIRPGMEVDEEMRRKIAVSVAAVTLFVVALVGVGAAYNSGGLTETGGYALVGVIAAFVVLMSAVGLYLARSS